jgi:hypothetical protein
MFAGLQFPFKFTACSLAACRGRNMEMRTDPQHREEEEMIQYLSPHPTLSCCLKFNFKGGDVSEQGLAALFQASDC